LFNFNDFCKLPESLLRFDITAIFGRNQLENALQAPREPIRCPVQEPAELDLGKPCSSPAIGCSARSIKRPKIKNTDRIFWVVTYHIARNHVVKGIWLSWKIVPAVTDV